MAPDPARRWLLDLCLGTGVPAAGALAGPGGAALAERAARLGVESWVLQGLSPFQGELAGAAWLDGLRRRVGESAVANLRRDRALGEALARLAALGLDALLLKGAALRRERPELAGRFECDADLLLRRADLDAALAALAEIGFAPEEPPEDPKDEHPFHVACRRGGAVLELHWDLDPASPPGFVERLWEGRRPLAGSARVFLLAPEHQLLFACLHLSRHAFLGGLRWLADLRSLLPVPAEVRARFAAEARHWPRRAVDGPLWLLERLGVEEVPLDGPFAAGPLERRILPGLLVHLLVAEPWLGLPCWRLEAALRSWLFAPSQPSLPALLARAVADGITARLRGGSARISSARSAAPSGVALRRR